MMIIQGWGWKQSLRSQHNNLVKTRVQLNLRLRTLLLFYTLSSHCIHIFKDLINFLEGVTVLRQCFCPFTKGERTVWKGDCLWSNSLDHTSSLKFIMKVTFLLFFTKGFSRCVLKKIQQKWEKNWEKMCLRRLQNIVGGFSD